MTNRLCSYKLAEKLSERLDEMGKDLTQMIEEVNNASATLSRTNKADEPVCSFFLPKKSISTCVIQRVTNRLHTDLPNRPHPQLPPRPAAAHRPGHRRAAGQGQRRPEGRAGARLPTRPRRRVRLRRRWQHQQRRRWRRQCSGGLLSLVHGTEVDMIVRLYDKDRNYCSN